MLDGAALDALLLSLRVSLVSALCSLPFGVATAWLLARRRFFGKLAVELVVHLPLVLPPVVTGYLLLLLLGGQSWLGRALARVGLSFSFSWLGAALAAAVMGFPLLVRAVRLSFESVDPAMEQVSLTLGAGPWRTFWRVTLPLAWPGVITGALLAFARSLGEFGATIVFVGNIAGQTRTLPLAIYTAAQTPGAERRALVLVLLAVALSTAALAASEWSARRVRRAGRERYR